jgi:hypothetical protein
VALAPIATLVAAISLASAANAQTQPKPLFASNTVLHLTIRGPLNQIARTAEHSRVPRDGSIVVPGAVPETLAIQLSPRGITRLRHETCQFPPLRVRFQSRPGPGSLFAGQKQLKLVTHCQASASFQQYLLLEYSAYLVYNQLTPVSHRARLAMIDYVDDSNKPITTRYGFFLEDIDDVAARNGMRSPPTPDRISSSQLSPVDAARVGLFEYMIGNTDWSMRAGPAGQGCCHNSRLLTRAAGGAYIPVPYDFDYSGLVNAPYAVSPDGKSDVLKRRYMGYCKHNADVLALSAAWRSQRATLLAALAPVALDESSRRRANGYLISFFNDIADDGKTSAKVLKACS